MANNKEKMKRIRDYADCADASYAMLHYVVENERKGWLDDIKVPPLWQFADNIRLGYEIKDKHFKDNKIKDFIEKNKRELGQPTAYALAIEARFMKDVNIKKPKQDNPNELKSKLIDNKIQNFIYREENDSDATQQTFLVATTKEQQGKKLKNANWKEFDMQ